MSKKLYKSSTYRQSADIAILCGVVAHQVLTKETALDIVKNCHSILRENGIIIAASLSAALINSQEYEEMGYDVLNKTISYPMDRGPLMPSWVTTDFYILQRKPSLEEKV